MTVTAEGMRGPCLLTSVSSDPCSMIVLLCIRKPHHYSETEAGLDSNWAPVKRPMLVYVHSLFGSTSAFVLQLMFGIVELKMPQLSQVDLASRPGHDGCCLWFPLLISLRYVTHCGLEVAPLVLMISRSTRYVHKLCLTKLVAYCKKEELWWFSPNKQQMTHKHERELIVAWLNGNMYVYIYIYIYTHTYIHTYVCIYIYICMCLVSLYIAQSDHSGLMTSQTSLKDFGRRLSHFIYQ